MRANGRITHSGRNSPRAHAQVNRRAGPLPQRDDVVVRELNKTRADALRLIDESAFSWFHLKVCLVAGTGFFTDAYDIFAINLASIMLGYVYGQTTVYPDLANRLSKKQDFAIKVAAPIGNLFGQLLFGWLADIVGRKRIYGIELMIIVTATFAQTLSGSGHAVSIVGALTVWRFILGVGVGGDYPLSSVIASEFSPRRYRGRLMTTVFTAQGWGNFVASLVALLTILAYKDSIIADNFNQSQHVDHCWRVLIGLGCVPGTIALYFRLTIPETPRFTMDIERDVQRASADIQNMLSDRGPNMAVYWVEPDAIVQRAEAPRRSRRDFIRYFGQSNNLRLLFGVAYSWFAIDVAFYGLGLNLSSILSSTLLAQAGIGEVITPSELNTTLGLYKSLRNEIIGSLVVSVAGLLPGYYATFALIDIWGRKPIQYMGFAVLTVLLAILASVYPGSEPDSHHQNNARAFVTLFCLANFFSNFGPNVTTFIIPGEIFPTRYRSTGHGIAAACGKLGAIVSQIIFFKVRGKDDMVKAILGIFAGVTLTGIGSTWLLDETMHKSLEQLSREQQQEFVRGVPISRT